MRSAATCVTSDDCGSLEVEPTCRPMAPTIHQRKRAACIDWFVALAARSTSTKVALALEKLNAQAERTRGETKC
jgi:hypothetical protein